MREGKLESVSVCVFVCLCTGVRSMGAGGAVAPMFMEKATHPSY